MKKLTDIVRESIFDIDDKSIIEKHYIPKNNKDLRKYLLSILEGSDLKDGEILDLNFVDISKVDDMTEMFADTEWNNVNFDVSHWDVSHVKEMSLMFFHCEKFDCDLSRWQVGNVIYMDNMFDKCTSFTGKGLDKWKTYKLESMSAIFKGCKSLNVNLNSWKIESVWAWDDAFENSSLENNVPKWYTF